MKTACGTAEYVAPEVLLRTPYTVAVDLWAVGVITYILISGQMPFDDQNKMILYKKILKANYDLDGETWQNASTQCKSFIQSLLILHITALSSCFTSLLRFCLCSSGIRQAATTTAVAPTSTGVIASLAF